MENRVTKSFLFCNFYAYFVNGFLVLMTGAILTYLMEDYQLSYNLGGVLVSIQAAGYLLSGLFSGAIIYLIGRRKALLLVAVMFTIGFGGIVLTSSPTVLFILMFLSGIGWGLNNNLLNIIVSETTNGNSSYTNILHMAYAVGAFVSPLIVSAFVRANISWKVPVGIVAVASILLFFVFLKIPLGNAPTEKTAKAKLSFDFLKDPKYFVYIMILFCYVGSETGLNSWLITYLVELEIMDISNAQMMLSLLWVVIIFGRIFIAYISRYIRKDLLLLYQCIGMFVFLGLFLINKDPVIAIISIVLIGISMAGIYPTTVSNAHYIITGAGLSSGIMFSGGGLGATVVPYVAGAIAENNGILSGMISTLVIVMVMVILALLNIILIKKEAVVDFR